MLVGKVTAKVKHDSSCREFLCFVLIDATAENVFGISMFIQMGLSSYQMFLKLIPDF
jgi:hypothetical protein